MMSLSYAIRKYLRENHPEYYPTAVTPDGTIVIKHTVDNTLEKILQYDHQYNISEA